MTNISVPRELLESAQAVVDRWDTPLWKDVPATAVYIERLRRALLAKPEGVDPVRVVWEEIDPKYNWVAMDEGGAWCAYSSEPYALSTIWDCAKSTLQVGGRAACCKGTDWRTTLRKRPGTP